MVRCGNYWRVHLQATSGYLLAANCELGLNLGGVKDLGTQNKQHHQTIPFHVQLRRCFLVCTCQRRDAPRHPTIKHLNIASFRRIIFWVLILWCVHVYIYICIYIYIHTCYDCGLEYPTTPKTLCSSLCIRTRILSMM